MKESIIPQNMTSVHKGINFFTDTRILSFYMQATGSNVQIFNSNAMLLELDGSINVEQNICRYCTGASNCGNGRSKCHEMHVDMNHKSGRNGRALVYQCELGLTFWVSPVYNEGTFSGVLRGSGCQIPGNDALFSEKFDTRCSTVLSPDEFKRSISALLKVDGEKIQSLAEMLLVCAESISTGSVNHHELLRLRFEQQTSLFILVDELKAKYPKGSGFPGYPLDKERRLIASLRQGDKKEAEKLLNEVLSVIIFCNQNQFKVVQLRALELAVLLTRTRTNSDRNTDIQTNNRYIRQIREAKTVEELTDILHRMTEYVAVQIISFQDIPHASAIRKAEIYIKENLNRKISLREIAKIAGLSAPYFSTIFKEEMGESLSRYVNRQKVEKATKLLLETNFSLCEIANACCFEDQSWFSKIFKSFTGISPGKYRSQGGHVHISA
jgi:AraC-like DNA-binding protein/ligand-binding sensor protein